MSHALELARLGAGWVNPNPMVGCVIANDDGIVIGQGWHKRFGALHAEREALADCEAQGFSAKGAIAYVTLEPCCHWGKTPPCVGALIEAGISRVVIGCLDPNPLVSGKGAAGLQAAGIDVEVGVLEEQCRELNRAFFHYVETGRPYVVAKYAVTLDGRIAARTGESKWITGEAARAHVHSSRARYAAVMVGIGTVLSDDPMLNCRVAADGKAAFADGEGADNGLSPTPHQPVRIACDARLRTPLDSQLVKTAKDIPFIIATSNDMPDERLRPYEDAGCSVIRVPSSGGRLDMESLMSELGKMQIDSVYVEGGPTLLGSLLDAQLIDYVQAYIAPKLIGGVDAPAAIGGLGVGTPQDAASVMRPHTSIFGEDILIEGEVRYG